MEIKSFSNKTSTSNHDAVAVATEQIPRRLLKTSDDKEDAFNHDVSSLLHLKEYDRTRYENLDFTRCNDDVIREVLPRSHNKSTTTFPYCCRSSLYLIRKHVRGEMSNNLLSLETKEFAHEYRPTPSCIKWKWRDMPKIGATGKIMGLKTSWEKLPSTMPKT